MTGDQLNSIVDYLKFKGINAILKKNSIISFYINISGTEYEAECILDDSFPYSLPEIIASTELFDVIKNIPHVASWKTICTFDSETTVPNFESPETIVYECISKAIELINIGLAGLNEKDYIDESLSYWMNKTNIKHYFMIGDSKDYKEDFWYSNNIIAPKKRMLKNDGKRGIILHASFIFKGNYNFYDLLYKELNKDEQKRLFDFIGYNIKEPRVVIIENSFEGKTVYFGLLTPVYKEKNNGFRAGKTDLFTASNLNRSVEFEPIALENTTQDYLYKRGGTGVNEKVSSACIIGCGSFGSYLSELLMDYGVKDFMLVDNDILTTENIARHLCGFSYVGNNKADSIGKCLKNHNPNISYLSFNKNIHSIITEECDILNKYDCIFVCVGSLGTEKRFFDLIQNNTITKPVVIIWGEPYCLACHSLVINNNLELFPLLYNQNMKFVDSVVSNGDSFYKRESGCRSTYIPYSSYMIKSFLIDFLFDFLEKKKLERNNYSYIWLGDLSIAEEVGAKIYDEFSMCKAFTSFARKIS